MTSQIEEIKNIFEYEIKRKLSERSRSTADEFRKLMNGFKFYDYTNSGKVNQTEFVKGILRTGLSGFNESDIRAVFDYYDMNKTGYIDYRNFCNYLYQREPLKPLTNSQNETQNTEISNTNVEKEIKQKTPITNNQRQKTPFNAQNPNIANNNEQALPELKNIIQNPQDQNQIQQEQKPQNQQQNIDPNQTKEYFQKLIMSLKDQIHTNNGITYYSFLFELKNASSQNQNISLENFANSLKNIGLNIPQNDIINFFNLLDFSGTGNISIDDIINTLVDPLTEHRKLYVVNKFAKMDVEKQGEIKVSLLKESYNPRGHPDFISGKISDEEIFKQFCFTLDIYCAIRNITDNINYKQFLDYYSGISSSILDDTYFEGILNVWDNENTNNNQQQNGNNNNVNNNMENISEQEQIKINEQNNNITQIEKTKNRNSYSNIFDNQNMNNRRYLNEQNFKRRKPNYDNGGFLEQNIGINSLFFGEPAPVAPKKSFAKLSFKKNKPNFGPNFMYNNQYRNNYQNKPQINNNKSSEFMQNNNRNNNQRIQIAQSQTLPANNPQQNNQFEENNKFNYYMNNNRQNNLKIEYNPISNEFIPRGGNINDNIINNKAKTPLNQIDNNTNNDNATANTSINTTNNPQSQNNEDQVKDIIINSLNKLKYTLILRGSQTLFSFLRKLSVYDLNHQGLIDFGKFSNIVQAYAMNISQDEIKIIFDLFDKEKTGSINYNELIQTLIGPISPERQNIIQNIYEHFNKDNNGKVLISEIKLLFNSRKHPYVMSGKKNEGEIFGEFLDNIESYKEYLENLTGVYDNSLTLEDFINFYNLMGITIDDDKIFEIMMKNCWNLDKTMGNNGMNNISGNKYKNNGYGYRNSNQNNGNLMARAGSEIINNKGY